MMKRLFAVLFTAFVTAGCCLPCYASEDPACEKAEYVTGDVFARYVREIPWEEAPAEDGIAVILTDDGYEITVEDIPDGAAGLRVFPVPSSETSGRGWIAGCIGEKYEIQDILDIYFADINGDRINADGVTVLIEKKRRRLYPAGRQHRWSL